MKQGAMKQGIVAAVAGITGHDPADLDEEMSLEADLGLDSIKMVELLQALQQLVPGEEQERFRAAVPAETLLKAQTIGDLVRALSGWCGTGTTGADAAPATDPAPQR